MKIFLSLVFISLVVGNAARIQFGSIAVSALDISILILFLYWLTTKSFINVVNKSIYLKRPFLVFVSACIASLLINFWQFSFTDLFIGSLYLLRWMLYASVFFIVSQESPTIKEYTKKMMYIAGAILVTLGFLQYFIFQDLRNLYYYGWDDHLYRLVGTFLDPNFTGVFIVLFILFIINNIVRQKFTSTKQAFFVLLVLICSIIALLLTYSRTSYLSFLVGIVVLLALYNKKKFIVVTVVAVIALVLLFANSRLENTNLFRTVSSLGRLETAHNSVKIFQRNPLFGVGFNMYRFAQHNYGLRLTPLWSTSHADAGADTSFLFILATTGFVGFISYLYLWSRLFAHAFTVKNKVSFARLFIASAVALFVSSIFINSLFYTYIMVWMWILSGLMD